MATGGPETRLSTGQPIVPSLGDGIEATRMDTIPVSRSVSDPQNRALAGQIDIEGAIEGAAGSSVAPSVPEAGDPSGQGSLKTTLNEPTMPNARLTQADFYGQPDPQTIQTRTGPTTVASFGQVPLAISGMQLAEIQKQRKEKQDALKNFDLYAGIGKAPSPYQRNFAQLAMGDMDKMFADVVQMHGGNRAEAVKEMQDPSSDLNHKWRARAAQWEAVGSQAEAKFQQASALLDAAKTGKVQVSPEAMQVAQEVFNGIGEFQGPNDTSGGDVMKLADTMKRFDQIMSREAYIQDFAIPGIEAHMAEKGIVPKTTRNKYGQKITTYGSEKDLSLFRDQAAKDMAYRGIGEGRTIEDRIKNNKKALEAAIPNDVEVKVDIANPATPSSSGSPATDNKISMVSGYAPQFNVRDVWSGQPKSQVKTIVFSEDVGGKNKPLSTRTFEDENQRSHNVAGAMLQERDGKWKIVGVEVDDRQLIEIEDEISKMKQNGTLRSANQDKATQVAEVSQKLNIGKPFEADYKDNSLRAKSYFGPDFDPDAQWGGSQPAAAPAKRKRYNPATGRAE